MLKSLCLEWWRPKYVTCRAAEVTCLECKVLLEEKVDAKLTVKRADFTQLGTKVWLEGAVMAVADVTACAVRNEGPGHVTVYVEGGDDVTVRDAIEMARPMGVSFTLSRDKPP